MSQNLNLSVAGIYTSLNDFNGLPPGALDAADNLESRFKNVMSPRRGFEALVNSATTGVHYKRLTNFYVQGVNRIIALSSDDEIIYYTGTDPWPLVPGDVTSHILNPDDLNGKVRFLVAGQNLYVTAQDGVRSLSSGSDAQMIRAGVPKGLNLEAVTNDDQSGFFNNNVSLATTGTLASGSAIITSLDDTTSVTVGQYVTGTDVDATLILQDLTYTASAFGSAGNSVTVAYTGGGTAGSEVVTVLANAISVQIQNSASTATQIRTALLASTSAMDLVSVGVSGTGATAQTTVGATSLSGGLDNTIPIGTKVDSITPEEPLIIQDGDTTAGSASILNVPATTGIIAGVLVTGIGIPEGTKVVSTSGGGPYTVVISQAAFQTDTGVSITYTSPIVVMMDQNALVSATGTPITFYAGAQVGYRMLFGRVETDIISNTVTRVGAPSAIAVCNNISPYSTNTVVTGTLPKNAENEITFVQLFRSSQTDSISISPLDQYNLVYERSLTGADFTNRTVSITDNVPDSLIGIPLYAGADREGILQANNPPPMCWDMCKFRDFTLYGNITRPSTLKVTLVSVGSPSGVQVGDTITFTGSFLGVSFTKVYTAASSENAAARQFKVTTSGTPSQNITDTANSLIRVVNYDQTLPVHAILLSSTTDLPGQILFESDNPSYDIFYVTASLHQTAYDPTLSDVESEVNTINNGVGVSKSGELEAVPSTNLLRVGDTSANIIRIIPLRDYVVVLKTDGIYKIQGTEPASLVVNPFDLTTKIIGADTAVSLNSGVWMLSNQGVVSISDGGVDAKSIPIDDQLNRLIGTYLENLKDSSFAVGYESDRKYILCVPTSDNPFAQIQYNFNYVTNAWTTWSRNFYTGFVHSVENKLYISRADELDAGVSKERKQATYKDFVDEAISKTILSVEGVDVELDSVESVEAGDILYQDTTHFSPILSVNLLTNVVTLQYELSFVPGVVEIQKAYECTMTWKQVFGQNPAFVRQYSEGLALFKNTRFNVATASFVTDFSQARSEVTLAGTGNSLWGLFAWGEVPWGGTILPSNIRFYIPQDKQLGSYLLPSMSIKQGYSDFLFQGVSVSYNNVSMEVGK